MNVSTRNKFSMLAVVIASAFLFSACDMITLQPDKSIYHVGDSITMSVAWGNDSWKAKVPKGYSYKDEAFMGDKVADHLADVKHYSAKNTPERLVIELGSNDAAAGWPAASRQNYQTMLNYVPARTCVVAVLPYRVPNSPKTPRLGDADYKAFDTARTDITRMVKAMPRYQIADMAEFAKAHPERISTDGLHLYTDTGDKAFDQKTKDLYRDWVFSYVEQCRGGRMK